VFTPRHERPICSGLHKINFCCTESGRSVTGGTGTVPRPRAS
jgi:hypothetical protein